MAVTIDLIPGETDIPGSQRNNNKTKGKQPETSTLDDSAPLPLPSVHHSLDSLDSQQQEQLQRLQEVLKEIEEERVQPNSVDKLFARFQGWLDRHLEKAPSWIYSVVTLCALFMASSITILTLVAVLAARDGILCWGWLVGSIFSLLADLAGCSLPVFAAEHRFPPVVVLTVLDALAAVLFLVFSIPGVPQVLYVGTKHAHETSYEQHSDWYGSDIVTVLKVYAPAMIGVRCLSVALAYWTSWYKTRRRSSRAKVERRSLLPAAGPVMSEVVISGALVSSSEKPLPMYA